MDIIDNNVYSVGSFLPIKCLLGLCLPVFFLFYFKKSVGDYLSSPFGNLSRRLPSVFFKHPQKVGGGP